MRRAVAVLHTRVESGEQTVEGRFHTRAESGRWMPHKRLNLKADSTLEGKMEGRLITRGEERLAHSSRE